MTLAESLFDAPTRSTPSPLPQRTLTIASDLLVGLANLSLDILVGTSDSLAVWRHARPAVAEASWTNAGVTGLRRDEEPNPAATALIEIRRLSEVTWAQLAQLMGVDRRSVHSWATGGRLSSGREERLYKLLAAARENAHGGADATRRALFAEMTPDLAASSQQERRSIKAVGISKAAVERGLSAGHPVDRIARPE